MTASASPPQVSFVMPVYDPHPVYFPTAVRSVLDQTMPDLELIIVEDPAPRSAKELLAAFHDDRIRHVVNPQRTSFAQQLNRGLELARADLIARMDADDVCEPDRLEKQVAFLRDHPDVDVLGSQLRIIDTDDRTVGYRAYPLGHAKITKALRRYSALAHPAVLFRSGAVVSGGNYRPSRFPGTEDYELWSRWAARAALRFANHPEPLLRYRIHPEAMKTARLRDLIRGTLEVKRTYWRDKMDLRAEARLLAEHVLLWLPARLVLSLFLKTQYRAELPARLRVANNTRDPRQGPQPGACGTALLDNPEAPP